MNILLFSDIPPCDNYTAGIVENRMCDFLLEEGHKVSCFTIKNPYVIAELPNDKIDRIAYRTTPMPREDWGHTKLGALASFVLNNYNACITIPRLAKKIALFAKEQGAEILWGIVQGQATIRVIRRAARLAGIPYVVQAWDPSEWWMDSFKFDSMTKKFVMKEYGKLMEGSQCFLAPSWAMAEEYTKQYGARSIPVMPGLEPGIFTYEKEAREMGFVIAFAGQMYAAEEIRYLAEAIELVNNQTTGPKIVLKVYGKDTQINLSQYSFVQTYGWLPQPALLKALAQADLLYCPYGFGESFNKTARLSFPSKLTTYLKANVPVLFHGPDYSSPYVFLKKHNAAYFCTTLEGGDMFDLLTHILSDKGRDAVAMRGFQAFAEHLTTTTMKANFFEGLGLPISQKNSTEAKPLKIVHYNNIDLTGGRFNGHDMQMALNEMGIETKQFTIDQEGKNPNTILISNQCNRTLNRTLYSELENDASMHGLVYPYGWELLEHPDFISSDVAHYHLIHNNILSLLSFPDLCAAKPSVWTLHDPWVLSGHCIYSCGCEKWKDGCEQCDKLDMHFEMKFDKAAQMWHIKKELYKRLDVDIVVASEYMKGLVQQSPLTAHFERVHLIPFGIDLQTFTKKEDKSLLRKRLSIPENAFVMMFRSDPGKFKGLDHIKSMLNQLKPSKQVVLLTVGKEGLLAKYQFKYKIKEYGWIHDERLLSELYAACDVFLMPSTAEAFGLMAIEAMASERPIIVTEGTSLPSVTFAPDCGIAIQQGNGREFADAIQRLMNSPEECESRGRLGRKLAEKHYRFEDYVQQHLELYREILERRAAL